MRKSVLILPLAVAMIAAAESTFVMATGFGSSQDRSEATANAIDQAETRLDNKCDGGRLSNIQTTIDCSRSGNDQSGYNYSCNATKSAQCERKDDPQ